MAEHEAISQSDEWYTPAWIFEALDIRFGTDPCAAFGPASAHNWCRYSIYKNGDGLEREWRGHVWLNPPFGSRNGIRPWLEKFAEHGDGIAIVPNRTATDWWQDIAEKADALLFIRGKVKFLRPDGSTGKSPGYGNVLLAFGDEMATALRDSDIVGFRA